MNYQSAKRRKQDQHDRTRDHHPDMTIVQNASRFPDLTQYEYDQRGRPGEMISVSAKVSDLDARAALNIEHDEYWNDAGRLVPTPAYASQKPFQSSHRAQQSSSRTLGRTDESNGWDYSQVNERNGLRGQYEEEQTRSRLLKRFEDGGQTALPQSQPRPSPRVMPSQIELLRRPANFIRTGQRAGRADMPPPPRYASFRSKRSPPRALRQRFSSPFFPVKSTPRQPTSSRNRPKLNESGYMQDVANGRALANTSAFRGSSPFQYSDEVLPAEQNVIPNGRDARTNMTRVCAQPVPRSTSSFGDRRASPGGLYTRPRISGAFQNQFAPLPSVPPPRHEDQREIRRDRLTLPPVPGRQFQSPNGSNGPKSLSHLSSLPNSVPSPSRMGQILQTHNLPIFGATSSRQITSAMAGRRSVRR